MVRRFSIVFLVVAGIWLIVLGIGRWLDSRAVSKTVNTYMTAVIAGDSETVLSLLDSDQRAIVEQRVAKHENSDFWAPQVGTKFRIHHVDVSGAQATAQLWIEKRGFVVQPTVHLHRSETTRWKVGRIENIEVDPLWDDVEQMRSQKQGQALAEELRTALKNSPGVSIERVPLDTLRR